MRARRTLVYNCIAVKRYSYVIVGASIAGLSAAGAIRSRDPAGSVLLIHGEDRLPYKRTQLSKQLFQGFSRDGLAVHPTEWYLTNRIELLQGTRAVRIEPSPREVFLSTGEVVGYQSLLIATGAEPATLAVAGSEHLTYLRWIHEAEAIALGAREVAKAVSIGFGVQGVELADQFAAQGITTSLVGHSKRLMDGHLDDEASHRLERRIRAAGVDVRLMGNIREVQRDARSCRLLAEEGELEAGIVAVSVGARSATDLADSGGLPREKGKRNGVIVGRDMKTGIEGIYAAGDAAAPLPGASWGLWHSAEGAGAIAGINMAGGDAHPEPRPYRLKCEAFGGYLFSLNYSGVTSDPVAESRVLRCTPSLYLRVWEREGHSVGAVLDIYPNPGQSRVKTLGKQLEGLILEGVPAEGLPEVLGI